MIQDILSGNALFRDVVTYTQLGQHRTGNEGEEITTDWIAHELEKAGLTTSFQTFHLRQYFVREVSLIAGDQKVDCFPWWYPCGTGPKPLKAKLVLPGTDNASQKGNIVLFKAESGNVAGRWTAELTILEIEKMVQAMADNGVLAVIVITKSPSKELTAINTSDKAEPWPIPVVLTGQKDEPILTEAVEQDVEVSLLVDGTDEMQAQARNVFGRLDNGNEYIVISTPKSGWFYSGGERGPGVALSLALARWAGKRQPKINYWFDFNSGHERFNLGTRKFIEELVPPPQNVKCWLHLGANIATWNWEDTTVGLKRFAEPSRYPVVCSDTELLNVVTDAFKEMPDVKPYVGPGIGELSPVIQAGYRGFGIYGGSYRFFHTPGDMPGGTAPELLEPMVNAVVNALEHIEELP